MLLALGGSLAPMVLGSGCAGGTFSTVDTNVGGSSAGDAGEVSGSAGTGATVGRACNGPEECDDHDSCTNDACSADGTCTSSKKCLGSQQCCGGDCADCCKDNDCDDGVSCTQNTCFMGRCLYVPQDSKCEASEFCSGKDGCRARRPCGILPGEDALRACDDGDGCTTDSCGSDKFCRHDFCSKLCCEGATGKAASACSSDCCSDAQCDTGRDPCMVGSCVDGKCSLKKLCPGDERCCPSADGKTASCGACCTAADCDDHVGCTFDQCAGFHCSSTPRECKLGYVCDAKDGCVPTDSCANDGDCDPKSPCQTNGRCEAGACKFDGCTSGTKCCDSGCGVCCSNDECNDNIACTVDACGPDGCTHTPDSAVCAKGQICDPQKGCVGCLNEKSCDDGLSCTTDACSLQNSCTHTSTCGKLKFCTSAGCVECLTDGDCQGAATTDAIGSGGCSFRRCVEGACQTKTETCDIGFCCPPYGCLPQCLQTQ